MDYAENRAYVPDGLALELGSFDKGNDGVPDKGAPTELTESEESAIERAVQRARALCERHAFWLKASALGCVGALLVAFLVAALLHDADAALPVVAAVVLIALAALYSLVIGPRLHPLLAPHCDVARQHVEQLFSAKWTAWALYGALAVAVAVFLAVDTAGERHRLLPLVGIGVFVLLLFVFSKHPSRVRWRPVVWGLALQFLFGMLILRWSVGLAVFNWLSAKITAFLNFTNEGSGFVYGFLVTPPASLGVYPVFAFAVLSTVIFFSSVLSVLYYLGVMQFIVLRFALLMQWTLGTTGAESLSVAGNIFVGQTEAPLLVKPYLDLLTHSELMAIMTGGFATIAGTVYKVYVDFGACGNHLLSASVMSAPAALAVSKLFYPETEESQTKTVNDLKLPKSEEKNALEAMANGACSGIFLVSNIVANLIAFLALLAFANAALGWLGALVGVDGLSFERLCSWLFYPFAFIMGASTEPAELAIVSELMGVKTFLNEFIAYDKMSDYICDGRLGRRAQLITTYALCGFSNISAVGIQLGGIGAMAPGRRRHLAAVAVRALIAGSVACFLTACVAGILTDQVHECVGRAEAFANRNCTGDVW